MAKSKCPRCVQVIAIEDTVQFRDGVISHVDCQSPLDLSAEERAVLYQYCWHHPVAECTACRASVRISNRTHLCPRCHVDLSASVRAHLSACSWLPRVVRHRVEAVRVAAGKLINERGSARGEADHLMREAEAAFAALRETMRQATGG